MATGSIDKLFARADDAFGKRNYDYAIRLYQEALQVDPGNVEARKRLRTTARKREEENGSSFLSTLKTILPSIKILLAKIKKDPEAGARACEDLLAHKPSSAGTLIRLGRFAAEADLPAAAIYVLEDALTLDPENPVILRELGHLYADHDERKAILYFQRLDKVQPDDKEAHQQIKNLAARITMKAGVERAALETGDYHDMIRDSGQTKRMEQDQRILKSSRDVEEAIVSTHEQIESRPDDHRLWVKLGDLHRRLKRYDEAREAYDKAHALNPTDEAPLSHRGDIELERLADRIKEIEARVEAGGGDAAAKELAAARQERSAFAVEEYGRRVKAHPTDLALRFAYGKALYDTEMYKEATAQFQQSVNDPKRKRAALQHLANCFMKQNNLDLAATQLRRALEGIHTMNEEAKQITYSLARILVKQTKNDEAREALLKIYEIDINYKDVAQLVEKLQAGR